MKIAIPERKKLIHEMRMPVRWGDMDAMGHVNNTTYFRYLESVRIEWFRSLGLEPEKESEGFLVINAFCTFHRQLEYPADIVVKMFASDVGRSSFESWNTIERVDQPGLICTSGGATTVWCDLKAQKSAPIPDRVRARLT